MPNKKYYKRNPTYEVTQIIDKYGRLRWVINTLVGRRKDRIIETKFVGKHLNLYAEEDRDIINKKEVNPNGRKTKV